MVDRPLAAHDLSRRLALLVDEVGEPDRVLEARALLGLTTLLRLTSRALPDRAPDPRSATKRRGRPGEAWRELLAETMAWRRGDIPRWRARSLARAAGLGPQGADLGGVDTNGNLSINTAIGDLGDQGTTAEGGLDWDRAHDLLRHDAPAPGMLLQALLGARVQRRRRGTFHTPREISRRLVRLLDAHGDDPPRPAKTPALVVDPAVGGGALVLAWLDEALAGAIREETLDPQDPAAVARHGARLIRENLQAFDRDPLAVEATRAALVEAAFPELAPRDEALKRVAVADAMADPMPAPLVDALGRTTTLLVNPPWASFSGRERQADPADQDAGRGSPRGAGWPALHTRFVERCLDACSPGVRAGLVLPAQVAGLPGYAGFRALYAERVRSVTPLGEGVFPGVTSPTVLVTLGPATEAPLRLLGPGDRPQGGDGNHEADRTIQRRALVDDPARPWTPDPPDLGANWPPEGFRLVQKAFGDRGIHSGNAAKRLFSTSARPGEIPVLVGADLHPYGTPQPSLWLDPGATPRAGEYFRLGDIERMRSVPLLLRQTADRPIAAQNPGLTFRNSVLAGFGVPGLPIEVCLAILNSSTAARIHRALSFDAAQRTFPQVKIAHLRRFPWPVAPMDAGLEATLIQGARAAQAAIAGGDHAGATTTIAVIDGLVEDLYAPVLRLLV